MSGSVFCFRTSCTEFVKVSVDPRTNQLPLRMKEQKVPAAAPLDSQRQRRRAAGRGSCCQLETISAKETGVDAAVAVLKQKNVETELKTLVWGQHVHVVYLR